jgi:DNA-binding MarR family transcriptional regulator
MKSAKKAELVKTRRAVATPIPNDPAARVLRRFRLVFNAVKTHFREVEKKAGVAGAQVWALSVIRDRPDINVTDVARAMDVHQSTASNLIKTLIAQQLVSAAKSDSADRRRVQLRLMPAGARILRRAPGPFAGVLPAALANVHPKTLARLDKDLGELISALGADERGAGIPLGQA